MYPVPIALWNATGPISISPAVGALHFTGQPPIVIAGRAIFPSAGSLAFTDLAPIVTVSAGNIARTPSAGSLAITGAQPTKTISGNQTSTPSVGTLHFTGQAPVVTQSTPLGFFLDGTLQNNVAATTTTYTMVGSIPIGRRIAVIAGKANNLTLASVSDSKGNVYHVDITLGRSGAASGIATAPCTVALAPGDTISITWSGSGTGAAAIVGNIANPAASALDKTGSGEGGSGAGPLASTGTTTQAAEIVFGAVAVSSSGSITESSGYTNIASFTFAGATKRLNAGYKIVSVVGGQSYAPNIPAASGYAAVIATYKGA